MSGFLGGLLSPQTPEQEARAAGIWQGLLQAGAALAETGAPRVGGVAPSWGQGIARAAGGFGQGMAQGQQAYYQQAEQRDNRQRQADFTAAAGSAADDTLTPSQRALRGAIPQQYRGILGALGPQQGQQALAGLLTRAPQDPRQNFITEGGVIYDLRSGTPVPVAEAPQRPQWVGSENTGYGWAVPPRMGGTTPPAAAPSAPAPAVAIPAVPQNGGIPRGFAPTGGVAPASPSPPDVPVPDGPGAPVASPALRGLRDEIAQRRASILADPNLTPEQQQQQLRALGQSFWNAAPAAARTDYGSPQPILGRVSAGAPAPTGNGFTPVIPPRPQEAYRTLTPQEQAAAGLPTGRQFQRNLRTGQISEISGSAGDTTTPVAVRRLGPDGQEVPNSAELVPQRDALGRTPAGTRDDPGFERTRALRTEFLQLPPVREFMQVQPQVEAIRRAANINTAAADLDIVFAFAKMLDPTSVVREGEATNIVRTGGMFDQLNAMVARVQGGARLSEDMRRDLLRQAESRFGIYADQYDALVNTYRTLAQENGLPADQIARITGGRREGTPSMPGGVVTPPGASGAPAAPGAAVPSPQAPQPEPQRPASITRNSLRGMTTDQVRGLATQAEGLTPEQRAAIAADIERRARNIQMGRPE
ncbi:hypothetical protein [Rhodovarius lipocyclicus]|uniref:hypothetical protein n=1 Tax=Rhodovarius lipocyclicus TaxID=268410 RepID=UPI00135AF439|nr:hypothetical protein [Rhodovarius lipocyclicus]